MWPQRCRRYGYERVPGGAVPRNVEGMSNFGAKMADAANSKRSYINSFINSLISVINIFHTKIL